MSNSGSRKIETDFMSLISGIENCLESHSDSVKEVDEEIIEPNIEENDLVKYKQNELNSLILNLKNKMNNVKVHIEKVIQDEALLVSSTKVSKKRKRRRKAKEEDPQQESPTKRVFDFQSS